MTTVETISDYVSGLAPPCLAEEWDNTGLLVGGASCLVKRVMTCLTITPESAAEAVDRQADLIVSHHPLPFRPLRRITSDTVSGRLLLQLIRAEIAVISPHTAFDSARLGINQELAIGIGLRQIVPLIEHGEDGESLGPGRYGRFETPQPLSRVAQSLKEFLSIDNLHLVGELDRRVTSAAVACGSAGQFLEHARKRSCDLFVTGETNFHTCLEAAASGICMLLPGHYASERFAIEKLAARMQEQFADLEVWPSRDEHDPVAWI